MILQVAAGCAIAVSMATSSSLVSISSTHFTCNEEVTRDESGCQTGAYVLLQAEPLADDALAAATATALSPGFLYLHSHPGPQRQPNVGGGSVGA